MLIEKLPYMVTNKQACTHACEMQSPECGARSGSPKYYIMNLLIYIMGAISLTNAAVHILFYLPTENYWSILVTCVMKEWKMEGNVHFPNVY